MANGSLHSLLHYLRRLGAASAVDESDDGQLLRRFVAGHDEAAFTMIVRRYGAMVWGLCARRLGETPEAEDAFQATFLVLVRKAASLRSPGQLGPWLYGVAYRTALKLHSRQARQAARERPLDEQSIGEEPVDSLWRELRPILDEEVNRLPTKYRQPVLLCYLQGLSSEEAAQRLQCAQGTIFSRLARARDLLRRRLVRRGLDVSAGALTLVLADSAVARAVPPAALSDATIRIGLLFAAETASPILPVSLAALVEGVLRTMFLRKVQFVAILVLILGLIGTGVGFVALHGKAEQPPNTVPVPRDSDKEPRAKGKPKEDQPAKKPGDTAALLKARVDVAERVYNGLFEKLGLTRRYGNTLELVIKSPDELCLWSVRWLQAERESNPKQEDQIAALEAHLKRMTKLKEKIAPQTRDLIEPYHLDKIEWYRLEAELWLQRAKAAK